MWSWEDEIYTCWEEAMQCNAMQCNAMQCNATQASATCEIIFHCDPHSSCNLRSVLSNLCWVKNHRSHFLTQRLYGLSHLARSCIMAPLCSCQNVSPSIEVDPAAAASNIAKNKESSQRIKMSISSWSPPERKWNFDHRHQDYRAQLLHLCRSTVVHWAKTRFITLEMITESEQSIEQARCRSEAVLCLTRGTTT